MSAAATAKKRGSSTIITSTVRCAIYSRKSTTEGLDSDFNTLDAQREAALAYIASQRHEGWVALEQKYDDGGFSGGNLERPALQQLFLDIEAGKVDCVVVYKIDRLSRSLLDFAKVIEFFERHKVSMASITQQFSTKDSMGRLTMNILLSFAQFEREIIAERTSDKMSAARRKGKWVGGIPVLGYDVAPEGGKLLLNKKEGERVKEIFKLYLQYQSLSLLAKELNKRGWTTKSWVKRDGSSHVGKPFIKTNLHNMLTNVIYLGKVEHKGEIYEGEHESIIEEFLWIQVKELLKLNGRTNGNAQRNKYGALLKGLIRCANCDTAMAHTYTSRRKIQYRYYVCTNAQKKGYGTCPSKSLPAPEMDKFVIERIKEVGSNPQILDATLSGIHAEMETKKEPLLEDKIYLQKQQEQYQRQIKNILDSMGEGSSGNAVNSRLAEIEGQLKVCRTRLSEISRALLFISGQTVTKEDLQNALSLFDPVWDVLFPKEQTRILQLLINNVTYDGDKDKIAITFKPIGIKALAAEIKNS